MDFQGVLVIPVLLCRIQLGVQLEVERLFKRVIFKEVEGVAEVSPSYLVELPVYSG